jgi:hypothetical protein
MGFLYPEKILMISKQSKEMRRSFPKLPKLSLPLRKIALEIPAPCLQLNIFK